MAKHSVSRNMRRQVAVEAARLMLEQGVADYMSAKKKAAQRLGLSAHAALPTNVEIEQAVMENQRLFGGQHIETTLFSMRQAALEAMRFFEDYRPRLVGAVQSGAITMTSVIELHLFTDSVESVAMKLIDADIDYRLIERRTRMQKDTYQPIPTYSFNLPGDAQGVEIDACVYASKGERQPPICPIRGKPMVRIAQAELERLIDQRDSSSVIDSFFG